VPEHSNEDGNVGIVTPVAHKFIPDTGTAGEGNPELQPMAKRDNLESAVCERTGSTRSGAEAIGRSDENTRARPASKLIYIGCAGWTIPRESAAYFPVEGSHLERYSRVVNGCEINSSFYRAHKESTWERWSTSVPEGFRFSVKIPRAITHDAELKCGAEEITAFLKQVSFLGSRLGPLLIQLPPRQIFSPAIARRFFLLLRERHAGEVVLEARNETWFRARANALLKQFCIASVAADPACVPSAGEPGGHRQVIYFRLHGSPRRYFSPYSNKFLKTMAKRMIDLAAASRVWCIFDNTGAGFAMSNALTLQEELRKAGR
jgi:uncharacterized protein YecE (DUF72 family)